MEKRKNYSWNYRFIKNIIPAIAIVCIMSLFNFVSVRASSESGEINYSKKITINVHDSYYLIFSKKDLKNGSIVKAKINGANVINWKIDNEYKDLKSGKKKSALYLYGNKGKQNITVWVQPGNGGKIFKLKSIIKFVDYTSPFKKFKIGNKNYVKKYVSNYDNYIYRTTNKKKEKISFKLKPGWKLVSAYACAGENRESNDEDSYAEELVNHYSKIKNGSYINYYNNGTTMIMNVKNKSTKQTMQIIYYGTLNKY